MYVKYLDPGVFRAAPRLPIARSPSTTALTAVQRQVSGFRVRSHGRRLARFAPGPPVFDPPGRSRSLVCSPTPPEVSRPSGGVTAEVRSTRDYHPRHLPPLAFLKPSTVFSFRQLTCSVSYRHHLWDSKNTNDSVFLAVLTGPSWGQSRPGSQSPDTSTPGGANKAPLRCLQRCPPSTSAFLPCTASARLSPARLQATDSATGHADMPGAPAPIACHLPAHCVNVSLTEAAASNRFGRRARRHARSCRQTASA
jgi:hypothetical protein